MENLLRKKSPPSATNKNHWFLQKLVTLVLLMILVGLSHFPSYAQQTISGTVSSAKGEALPGVTVLMKGTTNGATTDGSGKFSLNVPADQANGTLVVSFIGYLTQEVAIANRSTINVALVEDTKALEEVVVVGGDFLRNRFSMYNLFSREVS